MSEYYLWLLQVMGAANPRSVQLLRRYGSAEAVYHEIVSEGNQRFLKPTEAAALETASLDKSRDILQMCEEHNYRVVTLEEPAYPLALKNIYNPPILLFTSGELPKEELCLAVVGTREACDYSFKVTKRLCFGLAKAGIIIVSGMAVGIDKTAHTAAVEARGRTIGVLACGFAVDYPKYSTPFRQEIVASGGGVVTELLPLSRGEKGYFNFRNRIMSGMSRGVLLIEAAERSGCHITANHAINQNRDLFCLPPADIYHPRFRGVIGYIRDGAIPVFDHSDILNEYLIRPITESAELTATKSAAEPAEKPDPDTAETAETETAQVAANSETETAQTTAKPESQPEIKTFNIIPQKPPEADLSALSGDLLKLAELLQDGAKTVDFLAEESGLPADQLSELLLELEIDGVIEGIAGSSYVLA
ncbi:MAG: DNA-processing protein DprA [Oscillospiraceae bacterium]|nr:DNA-processing protein DprA [Oscillospiraceae bacterium]